MNAVHNDAQLDVAAADLRFTQQLSSAFLEYAAFVLAGAAAVFAWMVWHSRGTGPVGSSIFLQAGVALVWAVIVEMTAMHVVRKLLARRGAGTGVVNGPKSAGALSH